MRNKRKDELQFYPKKKPEIIQANNFRLIPNKL